MGLAAAVVVATSLAGLELETPMLDFALAIIGLADLIAVLPAGLTIETGVPFLAMGLAAGAFKATALEAGAFAEAFLAAAGATFFVTEDFALTGILLLLNEYDERWN